MVQALKIFESQHPEWRNQETLHLVNGQEMARSFYKNNLFKDATVIPFNEAMCMNPTTPFVFSEVFIQTRANGHEATIDAYYDKVLQPLTPLFEGRFQSLVLWFGEDVFCQMNLLTLLAYLEQEKITAPIFLALFKEPAFDKLRASQIPLLGFLACYQKVLVEQKPSESSLESLNQAITRYLALQEENHAIANWIKVHPSLTEEALVTLLLSKFPEYGYGDSQYEALIRQVRNEK